MKICKVCKITKYNQKFPLKKNGYRENVCTACRNKIKSKKPYYRLAVYRKSAQNRSLDWKLTKEEFMSFWGKSCYYCGETIQGIGLDRKNNKIGYVFNNVVPCCRDCNTMKMILSQEEFINKIKKIANRF